MDGDRRSNEQEGSEIARIAVMRARRNFTYEFVLKMYASFGLLIAAGAAAYFELTTLNIAITPKQQFALIIAGTGVALSFMSYLALIIRRQREKFETEKLRSYAYTSEIVDLWANFEDVTRALLELEGDKFSRYSLRSMISKLRQEERITDADLRSLQEALELRNLIVHGRGYLPAELISRVATELSRIVAKLSRETAKTSS